MASSLVVTNTVRTSRAVAEEVEHEIGAIQALARALDDAQLAAHAFVTDDTPYGELFLARDSAAAAAFTAAGIILDNADERQGMAQLRLQWDAMFEPLRPLARAGATPEAVWAALGDEPVLNARLYAQYEEIRGSLDDLADLPIAELRRRLAAAGLAKRRGLFLLYGLGTAAIALVIVFGRSVRRDVLLPITDLREAATRVQFYRCAGGTRREPDNLSRGSKWVATDSQPAIECRQDF